MLRNLNIFIIFALCLTAIPFTAQAHEYGPPWGFTAAPGDNATACVSAGCHVGTVNAGPSGTKGVQIILPSGNTGTYVPGQTIQIVVKVTDSSKIAFGFEMTARMGSGNTQQAGSFTPTDANTQVTCADGSNFSNTSPSTACPAQFSTIQDIEQTEAGWVASYSSSPKGSYSFQFNWTAPSSSVGPVTFYVAANAGVGQPAVATPSNIYTSNVTLTPAASTPTPTITAVFNATFQATMAASTYVAIAGTGLSTTNAGRKWAQSDFTANSDGTFNIPTSLDGTTVTVGGVPAYVEYVSPGQVNIITPATPATGNGIPVVVSLNGQPSAAFSITLQNLAPSFFEWSPYLVAQHSADYTNVGKVGLFPGTPATYTTPAKPGETIILYGTGFGPTSPPFTPGIEYVNGNYTLSPMPTATVGGIPAGVLFAGLGNSESDVYVVYVTIPPAAPTGDLPLVVNVNGTLSYSGLITVQQ